VELISEIRSLSADFLPSLLDASVCGVSARQLYRLECRKFLPSIEGFSSYKTVKFHVDNQVLF